MNNELIKRVEELERWKIARQTQQITLPLDSPSQEILRENITTADLLARIETIEDDIDSLDSRVSALEAAP